MRRFLFVLALLPAAAMAQTHVSSGLAPNPSMSYGPGTSQAYSPMNPPVNETTPQRGERQGSNSEQGKLRDEGQGFAPDKARSAADQGYTPDTAAATQQALADYQAMHTPRQLGEQVLQPAPWNPVAKDRSNAGWLANWSFSLVRAGIPDAKIKFEAERLDRASFAAWANRQLITLNAFH